MIVLHFYRCIHLSTSFSEIGTSTIRSSVLSVPFPDPWPPLGFHKQIIWHIQIRTSVSYIWRGKLGNQQPTGCMAAWQGCMWQPCFKKEPDSSANWLCLLEVYLWYAWFSSQTFRFTTRNQCILQSQKYDSHLLDMKLCRKHHFQSKFLPNSSRSSGPKRLTLGGQLEGSFPRKVRLRLELMPWEDHIDIIDKLLLPKVWSLLNLSPFQ